MSFNSEFIRVAAGPLLYYSDVSTTNLYVQKTFGNDIQTLTVTNDHTTDPVQLSFDGATLESTVNAGETLTLQLGGKTSVYIKSTAGTASARVWAW